jgi:hypothetical protein
MKRVLTAKSMYFPVGVHSSVVADKLLLERDIEVRNHITDPTDPKF